MSAITISSKSNTNFKYLEYESQLRKVLGKSKAIHSGIPATKQIKILK